MMKVLCSWLWIVGLGVVDSWVSGCFGVVKCLVLVFIYIVRLCFLVSDCRWVILMWVM